jgi:site-specific recombinase XerD
LGQLDVKLIPACQLRATKNLRLVQEILGHEHLATTRIHTHAGQRATGGRHENY